jgi:hypothetical protein
MRSFLIIAAAAIGLLTVSVYANFGTIEPCGILRTKVRGQDQLLAILPDGLLDAAVASQFGPLTPLRCVQLLTTSSLAPTTAQPPRQSAAQPVPSRPAPPRQPDPYVPPPATESDGPKCVKGIVYNEEGQFIPNGKTQRLVIEQEQVTTSGRPGDTYCNHKVALKELNPSTQRLDIRWQVTANAHAAVFSNGYWHRQEGHRSLDVRTVNLLPAPRDGYKQVMITEWSAGANAGSSRTRIYSFTSDANPVPVLSIGQVGQMDIKIDGQTIIVNAYYIRPNDCNACGELRTVRLKFDPQTRQLAIIDPDQKSVEAFAYLRANGR